MKQLDKTFLTLQFRNQIYEKNGSEYQRFFEGIIKKIYPDFQRIKPYGKNGDAGNDGYCKSRGEYYQIYAPHEPKIKEADAARKLKRDFLKLKKRWDEIAKIKKYYFVYNNKYTGTTLDIERTITELERENPEIKFATFLANDLEELFLKLEESDILDLGFNISLTEAVANAYKYLDKVEIELDRENAQFAYKILKNINEIISTLGNDLLTLEYEILECRCLQKLERTDEAKLQYESIVVKYPNDFRALLYLSELYLLDGDFKRNKELLDQVEKVDKDNWLLKLENLAKLLNRNEKINVTNIDEQHFPDDHRMKANFYRMYAIALQQSGNVVMANSFIEKAIAHNLDRLSNYITKISFMHEKIFSSHDNIDQQDLNLLSKEIEDLEKKFEEIRPRTRIMLSSRKLRIYHAQKKFHDYAVLLQQNLRLIYDCYFDMQIDSILVQILPFIKLSDEDTEKLISYIIDSKNMVSDNLIKILIVQFASRTNFVDTTKEFLAKINKREYMEFIDDIKSKNYDKTLVYLKNDTEFAFGLANSLIEYPDLRKRIIENLPDEKDMQKDRLLLILNYEKQDYDAAFDILKKLDLSKIDYLECRPILEIAREKRAWEFMIIISEKLLVHEKNAGSRLFLKLNMFHANFSLGRYPEAIKIGREILEKYFKSAELNLEDKEMILARTIIAHFMKTEFDTAKEILDKYHLPNHTYKFKITIEAEVYVAANELKRALNSVVEGVKIKRTLSPDEYAHLYPLIAVKIGDSLGLKLESLRRIEDGLFFKIKDDARWFYLGDDNPLDAIHISKTNKQYSLYIGKKVNDQIVFETEYGTKKSTKTVEKIFSIELYILWQSVENFHKLAQDNLLNGVQVIEVPKKEGVPDFSYLKAYLRDVHKKLDTGFQMYCQRDLPFAMLAASEGSIQHALRRIQHEGKGYVHCSIGTTDDLARQEAIASDIIDKNIEFYIDGSSIFMLLGFNLLKTIYTHLPSLKIPQSVINLLYKIADDLRYKPGQAGYMQYDKDRISLLPIDREKIDHDLSIIMESIQYFESNSQNIGIISQASKSDCPSESIIPGELCDAGILAQKENKIVLTEDYLYLKWNELETKKNAPEQLSSIVLVKKMYERKLITFEQYLDYFEYLSFHRFKFMAFSHTDIIKAVFGDQIIIAVKPTNIRKLNFPLTLSEEYGVLFRIAFIVVFKFLIYVLTNDSIISDIAEQIFVEIIESFPTQMDKKDLGQLFLDVSKHLIDQNVSNYIITPRSQLTQEKLDKLYKLTKVYDFKIRLWKPKIA